MENKQRIETLIETYQNLGNCFDGLFDIFGHGVIDSELFDKTYQCFDRYKETVSEIVGDKSDWIGWYIYDNDCGEKGLEAGHEDNMKSIETIDDLLELIDNGVEPKCAS